MFAIPAPTDYDVKFPLLGIPVRVHPFFWAMAAALGWEGHDRFYVLVWVACVFVSILVHEFGHGLTAERLNRARPSVFLYLMGGLCSYDKEDRNPWRRAAVLIMGPGAGFLLFGLTLALGLSVLGYADFWPVGWIEYHPAPSWFNHALPAWLINTIQIAYHDLLWINLFWGLFNLLPIYPLDGGQLASVFLTMHDRREGPARAYIVGILTAGGVAIYLATLAMKSESQGAWVNVLFVANLGFMNYQLLQAAQAYKSSSYSFEDDDDWWRK
jgi:stage IV sporulation protein FB